MIYSCNNIFMEHPLLKIAKIGFIGAGNMTQSLIQGLVDTKTVKSSQIYASNRTPGKLNKLKEKFNINTFQLNEEIIQNCQIIILAVKPQDLAAALQGLSDQFTPEQIIISLAAGFNMDSLERLITEGRIFRLMPNTPSLINRGVIGLLTRKNDEAATDMIKSLFGHLGMIVDTDTEDKFDALMVSCSSGTGFVYELMMYWQDWISERGFDDEQARQMTIETFAGASLLAAQSIGTELENLQQKVASKKGVTAAGLEAMREQEIERTLRISFEKASMRSNEIQKMNK